MSIHHLVQFCGLHCKNRAFKKPDISYHVKITNVNFAHTCQMTTIFHRQALQKSNRLQPDLNGVNDIMSLLREKPMLQSEVLRPLLAKYLPFYKATYTMFIFNFRRQAHHWLVTNGDKELTMEEVLCLSSKKSLASEEFLLNEDNPMQKQNLRALLLRKVMKEDSSTWDVLRFLDELKDENPGLDY
jgi:cell division inhibitor SulA